MTAHHLTDAERAISLRDLVPDAERTVNLMFEVAEAATNTWNSALGEDHGFRRSLGEITHDGAQWWCGATGANFVCALAPYDPRLMSRLAMINAHGARYLARVPCDGRLTTLGELRALCPTAGRAADGCVLIQGLHVWSRAVAAVCGVLHVRYLDDQPVRVVAVPGAHAPGTNPSLGILAPDGAWKVFISEKHSAEHCHGE